MTATDDGEPAALPARHEDSSAVGHLRRLVESGDRSASTRLRLVDALVAAHRGSEAADELIDLADQYEAAGQAAKAIALLKRAEMVAGDPFESTLKLDDLVMRSVGPGPVSPASVVPPTPLSRPPLSPEVAPALPLGAPAPFPSRRPLLAGPTGEELLALVRGLRLMAFQPGDIVFAEGEPGRSLFVVASGCVKVFVRDAAGHPVLLTELGEGSFFGEIALLTGAPRSGTVTAGMRTELLELDRPTLDAIVATHARVGAVIRETARERAGSEAETRVRESGRS